MTKKIIIIDDDETVRYFYHQYFQEITECTIVAEFERAEEALKQIPHIRPDLAIVDYSLPGMNGIECAQKISAYPGIRVLVITSHDVEYLKSLTQSTLSFDIVDKFDVEDILLKIRTICEM
ncbi:MAG TPA: response regulator transcription factor [Spirochaetota bacterium]